MVVVRDPMWHCPLGGSMVHFSHKWHSHTYGILTQWHSLMACGIDHKNIFSHHGIMAKGGYICVSFLLFLFTWECAIWGSMSPILLPIHVMVPWRNLFIFDCRIDFFPFNAFFQKKIGVFHQGESQSCPIYSCLYAHNTHRFGS